MCILILKNTYFINVATFFLTDGHFSDGYFMALLPHYCRLTPSKVSDQYDINIITKLKSKRGTHEPHTFLQNVVHILLKYRQMGH